MITIYIARQDKACLYSVEINSYMLLLHTPVCCQGGTDCLLIVTAYQNHILTRNAFPFFLLWEKCLWSPSSVDIQYKRWCVQGSNEALQKSIMKGFSVISFIKCQFWGSQNRTSSNKSKYSENIQVR